MVSGWTGDAASAARFFSTWARCFLSQAEFLRTKDSISFKEALRGARTITCPLCFTWRDNVRLLLRMICMESGREGGTAEQTDTVICSEVLSGYPVLFFKLYLPFPYERNRLLFTFTSGACTVKQRQAAGEIAALPPGLFRHIHYISVCDISTPFCPVREIGICRIKRRTSSYL